MNFKENGGADPVTLDRGYTKLDGDPPNSGENVFDPEHVAIEREWKAWEKKYGMPGEQDGKHGPDGFLERDLPDTYERPQRSCEEDRG